jgi:UPF0716 family protein affecting phage T7 exclusion
MGVGFFLATTAAAYVADAYLFFAVLPDYLDWMYLAAIGLGTAATGLWCMRQQTFHNLRTGMTKLMRGHVPANNIVEAGLILCGGAFLVLPGLVSDIFGLLLLVPKTRVAARNLLALYVKKKMGGGQVQVAVHTRSL